MYIFTIFITKRFQSTLLQEERREILKLTPDYYAFNPRSYKRSDTPHVHITQTLTYFQSTLLQEERRIENVKKLFPKFLSIHAPTRGATLYHYLSI